MQEGSQTKVSTYGFQFWPALGSSLQLIEFQKLRFCPDDGSDSVCVPVTMRTFYITTLWSSSVRLVS